jgi:hypothetical protein
VLYEYARAGQDVSSGFDDRRFGDRDIAFRADPLGAIQILLDYSQRRVNDFLDSIRTNRHGSLDVEGGHVDIGGGVSRAEQSGIYCEQRAVLDWDYSSDSLDWRNVRHFGIQTLGSAQTEISTKSIGMKGDLYMNIVKGKNLNTTNKAGEEDNGSSRIRLVRFVYGLLAAGYLICVILQVFFAGLGVFVDNKDLELHRVFANYFEFVSIVMFLLSFFGRIRGGLRWLTLGLFALTSLQHMTIQTFTGFLPAFHTIDALLLFWISIHLTKRSWLWLLLRRDKPVQGEKA